MIEYATWVSFIYLCIKRFRNREVTHTRCDNHNFCTSTFWWNIHNINCTTALTARYCNYYCNAVRKSVASPIVHQIASIRLAECKHVITLKSH